MVIRLSAVPINTLSTLDGTLAFYNIGPSFAEMVAPFPPLPSRLLDLNQVFKVTLAISMLHRRLASKAKVYGPFYFKSYIENAWRKIPFVDMPSYLIHVRKFGIPVVQENNILAPSGTTLGSFELLPTVHNYGSQNSASDIEMRDAVTMSMHIFDALGIPREFFLEASDELV